MKRVLDAQAGTGLAGAMGAGPPTLDAAKLQLIKEDFRLPHRGWAVSRPTTTSAVLKYT